MSFYLNEEYNVEREENGKRKKSAMIKILHVAPRLRNNF